MSTTLKDFVTGKIFEDAEGGVPSLQTFCLKCVWENVESEIDFDDLPLPSVIQEKLFDFHIDMDIKFEQEVTHVAEDLRENYLWEYFSNLGYP